LSSSAYIYSTCCKTADSAHLNTEIKKAYRNRCWPAYFLSYRSLLWHRSGFWWPSDGGETGGTCNYFKAFKIPQAWVTVYCWSAQSACKLRRLALAWNVLQSRTEQGVSPTGTVCHIEESALITQVRRVMSRSLACFSFSMISRKQYYLAAILGYLATWKKSCVKHGHDWDAV